MVRIHVYLFSPIIEKNIPNVRRLVPGVRKIMCAKINMILNNDAFASKFAAN